MEKLKQHTLLVVGSSNTDMVIQTTHLPCPGETVLGGTFFMNPGGKGANQAVTVARLGGHIAFICKTGEDIFGRQARQLFKEEGIDTSYLCTDSQAPSGVALITVDEHAENSIVVASGANALLSPQDLAGAEEAIEEADWILMQLEIPLDTVEFVADLACRKHKKVVLNPAPAQPLPKELLRHVYILTPNETEAEIISGVKVTNLSSAMEAARRIREMGVPWVVITLGSKGALVYGESVKEIVPAFEVKAIDTTAAGDVFNGAFVVALSEGKDLVEAARFACKASALSVTRAGAQSSVPYRTEVDRFLPID